MRIFNRGILGLAAALAMLSGPAWAELTVEDSDVPGIEIDAVFPDDHVFEVPAGAKVELIKTPQGETHRIEGRSNGYTGTLGDYIQRECWRRDADCGPLDESGGGTKGLHPGGVRSFSAPKE